MPICHSKEVVFVHIPKTGGTSITHHEPHLWSGQQHMPLTQLSTLHPTEFNTYTKVCMVRNPWDRFVSSFEFAKAEKSHWGAHKFTHKDHNVIKNLSFKETVNALYKDFTVFKNHGWATQYSVICHKQSNTCLVDYIFKYETCKEDDIFNSFFPYYKNIHLNKTNSRRHTDYHDYYTKTTRDKIAELYWQDIVTFDYDF